MLQRFCKTLYLQILVVNKQFRGCIVVGYTLCCNIGSLQGLGLLFGTSFASIHIALQDLGWGVGSTLTAWF